VKLYRAGKPSDLSEFHTGDVISATIVTSKPPKVVTAKEVNASLAPSAAPAPATATGGGGAAPAARPASSAPSASPARTTAAAPEAAPAAAPAKKLPKTGGSLPLIGLIGLLSMTGGAALSLRRRLAR